MSENCIKETMVAIESLDDHSLTVLKERVDKESASRRRALIKTVANDFEAKCIAMGLSLSDVLLVMCKSSRKAKALDVEHKKVPPKYRLVIDGEVHEWTGRGKSPRWVTAYLAEGHDLESIMIEKESSED